MQVSFDMWTKGRLVPALGTNAGAEKIPFQTWRNFKEAFAPELIARAVSECSIEVNHCVDPFGGSGTTALSCQFLGIEPTTIEVSPYLADLIQAKLQTYDADELVRDLSSIIRAVNRKVINPSDLNRLPVTFVEPGVRGRWIFDREIALRIEAYRQAIDDVASETNRIFFKALLGGIVVDLSNVFVNGKGRRYRKNWRENRHSMGEVDWKFRKLAQGAIVDVHAYRNRVCTNFTLLRGDSRTQLDNVSKCELAIFSPPYPNSFDYTDVYNVELWMLGYLKDFRGNRELRQSTLCSHVQVLRDFPKAPNGSASLVETLECLGCVRSDLWSTRIPDMVGGYFHDMSEIISSLYRTLLPGGEIWAVVGDSRYAGVYVPVAAILAELAPSLGFEVIKVEAMRSMRASAQQGGRKELAESLLVFRKI